MSQIAIQDPVWAAIMADPELQQARRKLSFHEIRLIINHAKAVKCPLCARPMLGALCEKHARQAKTTGEA
jgi:hypothetical protein